MRSAQPGDRVIIHYIGTLDNGRIFATADADQPLEFEIGGGDIFPALEEAIVGMREGEALNLTLSVEQAYGPRRQENLVRVALSMFPPGRQPQVGEKISLDFADGGSRVMRVVEVDDGHVTLDGNHALAGCELTFALKLVSIA